MLPELPKIRHLQCPRFYMVKSENNTFISMRGPLRRATFLFSKARRDVSLLRDVSWGRWIERKRAPFEGYWKTLYA
jgi:hypothetical protein